MYSMLLHEQKLRIEMFLMVIPPQTISPPQQMCPTPQLPRPVAMSKEVFSLQRQLA